MWKGDCLLTHSTLNSGEDGTLHPAASPTKKDVARVLMGNVTNSEKDAATDTRVAIDNRARAITWDSRAVYYVDLAALLCSCTTSATC
jgi:hypothetical protein